MSSKVITYPNLLTFMRMALIPVFASLLFYGHSAWALFVFVIAGVSDGIDGLSRGVSTSNQNSDGFSTQLQTNSL